MDFHGGLPIFGSGEDLRLAGGDGGVARDELGGHAAQGFHPQGQGGDIQQQHVFDFARQHTRLDGRPNRHHLIGVDTLVGFFAQQLPHQPLHRRNAGGSPHQHHFVDVGLGELGIPQGLFHRPLAALQQVGTEVFKLSAGELQLQVFGPIGSGSDEGQVDGGFGNAGQLDLGFFRSFR